MIPFVLAAVGVLLLYLKFRSMLKVDQESIRELLSYIFYIGVMLVTACCIIVIFAKLIGMYVGHD